MAPEKSGFGRHFIRGAIVKVNVTSLRRNSKRRKKDE
jgi:hypothetical protein